MLYCTVTRILELVCMYVWNVDRISVNHQEIFTVAKIAIGHY